MQEKSEQYHSNSFNAVQISWSSIDSQFDPFLLYVIITTENANATASAFSVTSAALDLKNLIQRLHLAPSMTARDHIQDVYVYGVSYGTYLVERYAQIAPEQVKGIIIDGILAQQGDEQTRSTFTRWNSDVHSAGNRQSRFFFDCVWVMAQVIVVRLFVCLVAVCLFVFLFVCLVVWLPFVWLPFERILA